MPKITAQINLKKRLPIFIVACLMICIGGWQPAVCTAENRENSVVRAVRKVSPAVVNISSQYEIRKKSNPFSGYGMDPVLEKFFRDFFSPEMERREKRSSLGSGVIIDGTHGFVLTNAHVIEKAATISVALKDEREFEAAIIGMDPDSDLAVLKIKTDQTLPAVTMGDSDDVMIGESVIAIGNPFGFSHTVTTGVISAVNRSIKTDGRIFHEFLQIDASINPGNSGGPLLNINGELIGINTAIYAQAQGIGFAIPINRAKRIIADLINYGTVIQPWIGLRIQPLDSKLAGYMGIDDSTGVMVTTVEPNSPAAAAGINDGDIILSLGGEKLADPHDYRQKSRILSVDQSVLVKINRKGKILTLPLKPILFPLALALDLAERELGVRVSDLDEKTQAKYGIGESKGVLIMEIQRGSHLDRIGVRPGDIIRQIDEERVDNLDQFKQAIVKYREKPTLVLLIQRKGRLYYVNSPMKDNG